jgi:phi LC3 family holin
VTGIPVVLLLVTQVCGVFGVELDLSALGGQLVGIAETVFLLLGLAGIVIDMTTPGVSDSDRAMNYVAPGVAKENEDGV